jgi:hypothetical protein
VATFVRSGHENWRLSAKIRPATATSQGAGRAPEQCPLWVRTGHSAPIRLTSALRHKRTFVGRYCCRPIFSVTPHFQIRCARYSELGRDSRRRLRYIVAITLCRGAVDQIWESLGSFARRFSLGSAMLVGLFLLMSAINAARSGDILGLEVGFAILSVMGMFLAAAWTASRGGSLAYLRILWLLSVILCFVINNLSRAAGARWVQACLLVTLLGLASSLAAKKKVKAETIKG